MLLSFVERSRRPAAPVVALDLDARQLRVVYATPGSPLPRFKNMVAADVPAGLNLDDAQGVGQFIRDTLKQHGLTHQRVVMAVPRSQAILKTLSLPPVDSPRELPAMVRYQVEKELPFSLEDAEVDFTIESHLDPATHRKGNGNGDSHHEAPAGGEQVLAVAVRKSVIQRYVDIAQAAGVKLDRLGLRPYADTRCLKHVLADNPRLATSAHALIHVTATEAEIDVIVDGVLIFSRSVVSKLPKAVQPVAAEATELESPEPESPDTPSLDAQSSDLDAAPTQGNADGHEDEGPTSLEDAAKRLTRELARSLRTLAATQRHAAVSHVWIAGGTGLEPLVAEQLPRHVNAEVAVAPIDTTFIAEQKPAGLEDAPRGNTGFITAIGLAIGHHSSDAPPLDFLHPKRPPVERNVKKQRATQLSIAAAVLVVGLLTWGLIERSSAAAHSEALTAEYNALDKASRDQKKLMQRAKAIEGWLDERHPWLDHMAKLSAHFPPAEDAYIGSLSSSPGGGFSFNVKAKSSKVITVLAKSLTDAGYDVKLGAESTGKDPFGYGHSTTVKVAFGTSTKIDVSKLKAPPRPKDDGSADPVRRSNSRRR